jgi:hypothetical protein
MAGREGLFHQCDSEKRLHGDLVKEPKMFRIARKWCKDLDNIGAGIELAFRP